MGIFSSILRKASLRQWCSNFEKLFAAFFAIETEKKTCFVASLPVLSYNQLFFYLQRKSHATLAAIKTVWKFSVAFTKDDNHHSVNEKKKDIKLRIMSPTKGELELNSIFLLSRFCNVRQDANHEKSNGIAWATKNHRNSVGTKDSRLGPRGKSCCNSFYFLTSKAQLEKIIFGLVFFWGKLSNKIVLSIHANGSFLII